MRGDQNDNTLHLVRRQTRLCELFPLALIFLFIASCPSGRDFSSTVSPRAVQHYLAARQARNTGDFQAAADAYRAALLASPAMLPAYDGLVSICPDSQSLHRCDALFDSLLRGCPAEAGPRFGQALIHLQRCRYDSAITLLHSLCRHRPYASLVQLKLAETLRHQGFFTRANAVLDAVLKPGSALAESLLHAALLNLRGENLLDLGDLSGAERDYTASVQLAEADSEPAVRASALMHLSSLHRDQEEYLAAEEKLTEALSLTVKSGEPLLLAEGLRQQGILDWVRGYYSRALAAGYTPAEAIYRSLGHSRGEAQVLCHRAMLLYNQQHYYQALDLLERALAIQRCIGDRKGEAAAVYYKAIVLYALGEGGTAIEALQEAYARAREISYYAVMEGVAVHDYRPLGQELYDSYRAQTQRHRQRNHSAEQRSSAMQAAWEGRYREAIELAGKLLPYEREQKAPKHLVASSLTLASSYLALGELDSARRHYKSCLEIADSAGLDKRTCAEAHYGLGLVAEKRGDERTALAEFRRANQFEQAIYDANPGDEFRVSWAGRMAKSDLAVIRMLARMAEKEGGSRACCWEAFRHWQRCTSRRFNERLRYRLPFTDPFENPEQLQQELPPACCAIGYLIDEEVTQLFAVSADQFRLFTLPVRRSDLEGRVELLRALLDQANYGRNRSHELLLDNLLHRLYADLIGPLEQTGILHGINQLLIVPNQVLHHLPFAALMTGEASRAGSAGKSSYLIEKYRITCLPSAALLTARQSADSASGHIVRPRKLVIAPLTGRYDGARIEAEAIAALDSAHTVLWLDREATESRFEREASTYSSLHFAAHSRLNANHPESTFVALRADHGEDGLLTAAEIAGLKLQAPLVVLSSCESGLAAARFANPNLSRNYHPTDELIGLAQAFFQAGADRVLVTLWPVEDQASAVFMARFYAHLAMRPPDAALAETQREFIAQNTTQNFCSFSSTHPVFWAGYKLIAPFSSLH